MYGKLPVWLGTFEVKVEEMFHYTYLPIKLKYGKITVEPRLNPFLELIYACEEDFLKDYGWSCYDEHYIYLTAKNLYQKENCGFNREGWHTDGFMTDDINYIWSNKQPAIFNFSKFDISPCDERSMDEMIFQAKKENNKTYPNKSLLKLNQYVIHRVGPIEEGLRCFFKLSFSKDRYDLKGNSHNYLLNYNWKMRDRQIERNIPQRLN